MTTYNTLVATYHIACDDTLDSLFTVQSHSRTCDSVDAVLHTLTDGRTVCEFHHGEGGTIPMDAYFSDVLLCCHPELLPTTLRDKHPAPLDYTGECAVSVQGGLGEPVSIHLYTH